MKNKRVILTGGSSGLGLALVHELIRGGAEVCLVGRNEKALNEIAKFNPNGEKHTRIVKADLSKPEELKGLVERCHQAFGDDRPFDYLIYCAGYGVTGLSEEIPYEAYQRCWQVNFVSAVDLTKQVLPEMKKAKSGLITLIGSGVALRALPYNSPYCTAKAALHNFSESLRIEVARDGVGVLLFSPGPVSSNFHQATEHYGTSKISAPPFHGKNAEDIAALLLDAILDRRERVVLGFKASIAYHLNYWSPRLVDRMMKRLFRVA